MGRLAGKCALVTGAGRGIGAVIARRLAAEGARVVAADISGDAAELLLGDVGTPAGAEALVAAAAERLGGLDILVNNAAISQYRPALEIDAADWQRILDVNLSGPFFCARAAARLMLRSDWGRVINISSADAIRAEANASHYVAAKGGLDALTRALAVEWGRHGITVNAVAPGPVLTERTAALFADPSIAPLLARIPVGAPSGPEDVAAAVAFLASPEAGRITGHTLAVDGGLLAGI